jgi:hypothetical protein
VARLVSITSWLLAGAGLSAGAYWGFLMTSESSVPALLLSSALALLTLVLVAITMNGASLAWWRGWSGGVWREAIARIPAFVIALVVAGAIYWIVDRGTTWVSNHSGEISAWFIAQFGWADAAPVFNTVTWGGRWLQWVVAPLAGVSLIGSMLSGERTTARWRWISRALSPIRLVLATAWVAVFIAVPWTYLLPWRPKGLPPTSTEVAFVTTKLGVVALLAAIGVALLIRQGVPRRNSF